MKIKLIIVASTVVLFGCEDGFNKSLCRQSIVETMKTTDVYPSPEDGFKWIVRTQDGAVWYVETMGPHPTITAKTMIFQPKEPK